MFRESDLNFDGKTTWLSMEGRAKFGLRRTLKLLLLVVSMLWLLGSMAFVFQMHRIAGASAKRHLQTRMDGEAIATSAINEGHFSVLLTAMKKVQQGTEDQVDKDQRQRNLQVLFAEEKSLETEVSRRRKIAGEFEAQTLLTVKGKDFLVNRTATGEYKPEVVVAYMKNSPEISRLLHAANERALAEARVKR